METKKLSDESVTKIIKTAGGRPPRHQRGEKFLKGPIPLSWLCRAARLPGKTLAVALIIWFRAGITSRREVKIGRTQTGLFGIGRKAVYRGLSALESAGLISIKRSVGKSPIITILQP